MTSLDTKFQILEKAIKAIFKCKVLVYFNDKSDLVVRINLTTINFKDFIHTITQEDFRTKPNYTLVEDLVLYFVCYIRDFWVDSEAYDLVETMLFSSEE